MIHHIAFDGWSIDVFLNEVQQYYNHYKESIKLDLPNLSIQYKDFALWQKSYLTGEVLANQLNYWKKQLDSYENINLLTDYPRPPKLDYKGNNISFSLDKKLSKALRDRAKRLGVSLYTLLLSCYYLMLRSYTNQNDIIIGTPVANRHYPQVQHLIGLFVNTLALRINMHNSSKLTEFIKELGEQVIEAQMHQDLPFEKLVDELNVEKDLSRHPIFQVMFGLQSFGSQSFKHRGSNEKSILSPYSTEETSYNISKFDLETFINDGEDELRGSFNYRLSLYKESTIKGFINTYIRILEQVAALNDNSTIQDLKYLSRQDENLILRKWNATDKSYPHDKTVHALFEEQVLKTPDNIAVVYNHTRLSYRELNEKANQLAHYLIKHHDIKPDVLVGLLLDRSEHMIISILAVLKAGGVYVPIDPEYPDERIAYILNDTKTKIILTNIIHTKRIKKDKKLAIIAVDDSAFMKKVNKHAITNSKIKGLTSSNLAYVIYTSGTTGNPKGVMQLHSNVMRLFTATDHWFKFSDKDVWTMFHSYVFDFSIWEIWGALVHGGKLVIPNSNKVRDLESFYDMCKKEKVTILNQTPTAFYQFIEIAKNKTSKANGEKLFNLRYVVFGGERLNLIKLKPWFILYGYKQPKLVNMYGITETTVHVTYKEITQEIIGAKGGEIGKVLPDLKSYVLSSDLSLLPIGAIGELHIGGAGLARGYLNNASVTNEKFIS